MTLIGKHEFTFRGKTYEFELSHNEEQTTTRAAVYELKARSISAAGEPVFEIDISVRVDWGQNRARITYDAAPPFEIALDAALPEGAAPEEDVDAGWFEYVGRNFGGTDPISTIIDSIPPVDPIIGCLIRGALSATVSQLVRCWREVHQVANTMERARALARCMGANFFRITGIAMWRIGTCVIRAGF